MPSRRTCRRLATPLVTVLAVALAGCTSSPPPKSPTGAPGGTATAGGTLTVGVWQAPTTLLDAGITGQLDFGGAMAAPVEEGLLWYRSTTATATATSEADYWSPDLATSVPTVANGGVQTSGCADKAAAMCVTWHLRQGVRWDDGSDLTSHDVCDTFQLHWLAYGAHRVEDGPAPRAPRGASPARRPAAAAAGGAVLFFTAPHGSESSSPAVSGSRAPRRPRVARGRREPEDDRAVARSR